MKYNWEFREGYLRKINEFKEKDWVKNYIELKKKPNFWSIIEYGKTKDSKGRSAHETRYSKMFRWLLDPNANHNLGNVFAYKLMKKINRDTDYKQSRENNIHIKCNTEVEDIDVYYEDHEQKVLIAIEVKQFSAEHQSTGFNSQLDKYEEIINKFEEKENDKFNKIYIFLTPLEDEPSNKAWHAVGFKAFIDIIEEVKEECLYKSKDRYKSDILKIMDDFKEDLRRSMDILEKDYAYVMKNFSKEEIKFTSKLADEITHQGEGDSINKLMEMDKDNGSGLHDLILLVNDYISLQNHTPNKAVKLLMRKIFNYISEGENLTEDLQAVFKEAQSRDIKPEYIKKYGLDFTEIELTSPKGQGISLYTNFKNRRMYFSGDTYGDFPNDGMGILKTDQDKPIRSQNIRNAMFKVHYDLIKEDRISINKKERITDPITGKKKTVKTSEIISFTDFMENYLLEEIKILNDRLNESQASL